MTYIAWFWKWTLYIYLLLHTPSNVLVFICESTVLIRDIMRLIYPTRVYQHVSSVSGAIHPLRVLQQRSVKWASHYTSTKCDHRGAGTPSAIWPAGRQRNGLSSTEKGIASLVVTTGGQKKSPRICILAVLTICPTVLYLTLSVH